MARLTIQVCDTFTGDGANGTRVDFSMRVDGGYTLISSFTVGKDGRAPPLLEGETLQRGAYQIEVHVGGYYAARGQKPTNGTALDKLPIRFAIFDSARNYHIPVLFSPYGYTTYLGQ
jgi:5-hydroxyisourate hydrolase-like protein (transthyretin family)